jgi:hypothetical protein
MDMEMERDGYGGGGVAVPLFAYENRSQIYGMTLSFVAAVLRIICGSVHKSCLV